MARLLSTEIDRGFANSINAELKKYLKTTVPFKLSRAKIIVYYYFIQERAAN